MPRFRDYNQALTLQPTDAFVIDREGTGTLYIEGSAVEAGLTSSSRCITYVIDGGGSTLSTGVAGDLYIPFAATITAATLLADQTGSVVVDIWALPYSSYPPTISNSITGAALPTISSSNKYQDSVLTGWTTAIQAGSTLRFNVNSVTSITRLTLALTVTA